MNTTRSFHAVIPAAGSGSRMGEKIPKQYLPLAGRTVLEHAVSVLLAHPGLQHLVICIAPSDRRFFDLSLADHPAVQIATGGATRAASVRAGLDLLVAQGVAGTATVVVHDAARPCLGREELDRLLAADPEPGAVLGVPVSDTLKRTLDQRAMIEETLPREGLWRALTPQMFTLARLRDALYETDASITDESSAIERLGAHPQMIEGRATNLKVTHPADLPLAEAILREGVGP